MRLFALGGLGEVGMNCLALEQDGRVLIIDCGVTFDHRRLGVDVIHPRFSALERYRDSIAGVFLTHGHEDHIGALPYFLRRHDVPVFGPPYAMALVRAKAREHELLSYATLVDAPVGGRYEVGPFRVRPVRVTHSMPDATALAIETSEGTVVHTGDFKIDETPPDGEAFDEAGLTDLGDRGVTLLLSDSTNIDSEGRAGSEAGVGVALTEVVQAARGAVVVGLFASNVSRLRLLGETAIKTRRKLVLFGRSVETHARAARSTGYLDWPSDLVFPAERVRELPREQILGIATGTQGEERAALSRMASGEHPSFDLFPGDTFVLSSRIIPGSERDVFALIEQLTARGALVVTRHDDKRIHVSGHAHKDEQRRMLELVRPKAFVPVHGTVHHLSRHAALAREMGAEDVVVAMNGDVVELKGGRAARAGQVPVGRVHVWAGREVSEDTLRERSAMGERGALWLVVDATGVRHVGSSGLGDATTMKPIEDELRAEVSAGLADAAHRREPAALVAETARVLARRVVFRRLGYKPLTKVEVVG